jgi:hypothetical protein
MNSPVCVQVVSPSVSSINESILISLPDIHYMQARYYHTVDDHTPHELWTKGDLYGSLVNNACIAVAPLVLKGVDHFSCVANERRAHTSFFQRTRAVNSVSPNVKAISNWWGISPESLLIEGRHT